MTGGDSEIEPHILEWFSMARMLRATCRQNEFEFAPTSGIGFSRYLRSLVDRVMASKVRNGKNHFGADSAEEPSCRLLIKAEIFWCWK
jgi:hypothetical protein